MSPVPSIKILDPEINLSPRKMTMDTEAESTASITATDVASPAKEPAEESPEQGAARDSFDGFLELVGEVPTDAPPSDTASGGNGTSGEAYAVAGDAEEVVDEAAADSEPASEQSTEAPPQADPGKRRSSSELKGKLHAENLLSSATSVDSWGHGEGSLPPMGHGLVSMPEFDTTSGELVNGGKNNAQANITNEKKDLDDEEGEEEDVSQYVNIQKLAEPSSTQYYYSASNRANRQMLEKVKSNPMLGKMVSKKNVARSASLDESLHSKKSILSNISSSSGYRGPSLKSKDGSVVRSAMKKGTSSSDSLDLSRNAGRTLSEGGLDDTTPKATSMKRCSFSYIDIREHERVAGDNPCVTSGVPLSIGWGFYQHDPITLDDYEGSKGPARDKIEMMVPASIRRSMLRDEFGVSVSDMNAAMKEVNITKRQRRHTVASEHLEGWQEVAQSAKRKFKRFMKRTSTAQEEKKMWENAHKNATAEYLRVHGSGSLGKNPESAGVGAPGVGPKVVPEESSNHGSPVLEISFREGDDGAPGF